MLTSLLLFCLCALGRGSITRPWVRPIFYGMSAAREESIFRKSGQHYDWPLFASWDKPWQWLCVARQPWHVASPKRPSHGGRRLDFMGGGQKVKGAVGRLRLDFWNSRRREPCSATRLPACLRALLTARGLQARDPGPGETVEILQVALSEPARHRLQTAGKRAGVKVLLSRANGALPGAAIT